MYGDEATAASVRRQRYPRAGSQSYPTPAAEASVDGSTTVFFSPTKPQGVNAGNWIQTDPKKGWFTILRLYSPLEPFFTKEWRPREVEQCHKRRPAKKRWSRTEPTASRLCSASTAVGRYPLCPSRDKPRLLELH